MSDVLRSSIAGTSGIRRLSFARLIFAVAASVFMMPFGIGNSAEAQSQQPNIIFIMGDDIGWSNIGAYNQGIMAGRTPNLDRLAIRRHAVHRLLRRSELHGRSRELHHRRVTDPHRIDDRRSGWRHWVCRTRPDHRHRAQIHGLCHWPVRQEPPGRPEPVPANCSWVRRVLRISLSLGRDGGSMPSELPASAERHGRAAQHGPHWATERGRYRPSSRAGARSGSRRSRTRASSARSGWRRSTTRFSITRLKFIDKAKATASHSLSGSIRRACMW